MPAIPSPYPSGCRIVANDPRSYCECFGNCALGHPPALKYVIDSRPNVAYPYTRIPNRTLFTRVVVSTQDCEWQPEPFQGIPPFPFMFRLFKFTDPFPPNEIRWKVRIEDPPGCVATEIQWAAPDGLCCQDEFANGTGSWVDFACPSGTPRPDVNVWPVPFDFVVDDL